MQDKIKTKYFEIKQLDNIVYVSHQKKLWKFTYELWYLDLSARTSVAKVLIN